MTDAELIDAEQDSDRTETIAVLVREGDALLTTDAVRAADLYERALDAGGDPFATAARRAQAAVAMGDLAGADRILDGIFDSDDVPDVARAIDVASSAWAQRGMLERAAELYHWAGVERLGASAGLGAVAMAGIGDREGVLAMAEAAGRVRSPASFPVVSRLMADGIRASIDDATSATALPKLVRASDLLTASGAVMPLPETPAALVAIVAIHAGELEIAESAVTAALEGGQGGPSARPRLLLLRGWAAMLADQPTRAREAIDQAGEDLPPRELLMRVALEAGVARRVDDLAGLASAWHRAREVVLHVPVDLFSLLPLAELVIDAARARETSWLRPHLDRALDLLESLGASALWSLPLHWACVQAAILTDRPGDLPQHSKAIDRAARHSSRAVVLADAGNQWIAVLRDDFDHRAVERAANGLATIGLTWDGSRLAAHAAAHAGDRKVMLELMACARALHPGAEAPGAKRDPASQQPSHRLSPRELEVARLVMEGKTYREIGETIFISPRTAEHHIAEVRRRLGVTSRSELRERLRTLLGESA
jgi:DNA-binding CsgD family transcriptional regulator